MNEKIEEIRKRHVKALQTPSDWWTVMGDDANRDRHTLLAELDRLRAETEQLRDILRCVSVQPDRDRTVKISFFSEGCTVSFPIRPQTTWALEVLIEFDQARRKALEGNL